MRRPELAVAVPNDEHKWNKQYNLTQSPSIRETDDKTDSPSAITNNHNTDITTPAPPVYHPPNPSLRLLYAFCTRRDALLLLLPAISASILAGGIAPFMTQVVGQAFDAFSRFPLSNPSQQDKRDLLRGVGAASLELLALAAGHLALGSLMSCLWIWTGERNATRLRKRVYDAVTARSMAWYDLKLGGDAENTVGAGGLMTKFTRETDDVRNASSIAAGMVIQYLVTIIVCLVLAFVRSWALTLVILSSVPLVAYVQSTAQRYGFPLYEKEKAGTAKAGTLLERAVANISVVKAFNAASREISAFNRVTADVQHNARKSSVIWGVSLGFVQFQSMALFVVAFGFGSKLVRDRKVSPGDVMAVFWACLVAASSIQTTLPLLETLMKGKASMVALMTFVEEPTPQATDVVSTLSSNKVSSAGPLASSKPLRGIRGIRPGKCHGEFTLHNVTFAYPARPKQLVLQDVSMYIPAHETTFIVGGSGSGKSTIAQLLLRMYEPQSGSIEFDNQSFSHIDYSWVQRHVAAVSQDCMLFDMSVHDNVAMGVVGGGDGAKLHELATREQVITACRVALIHDFIRDLPEGYDTRLGHGGANLSGGQRQRLAIARAWIRDPAVLILDEATSALDPTSRLLVFEAIKTWRKHKTTIVITHDLSQITSSDFVYLLKGGRVVEQGYRMDLEAAGGEFSAIAHTQGINGFPEKLIPLRAEEMRFDALLQQTEEEYSTRPGWTSARQSLGGIALRPLTGTWRFDISDATNRTSIRPPAKRKSGPRASIRLSRLSKLLPNVPAPHMRRHSSAVSPTLLPVALSRFPRHVSLQLSPVASVRNHGPTGTDVEYTDTEVAEDDLDFEDDKSAMQSSGVQASKRRVARTRSRRSEDNIGFGSVQINHEIDDKHAQEFPDTQPLSVFRVFRNVCRSIPDKKVIFLGLVICLISGAMTPIFSFILSRLFFEVSAGAHAVGTITQFALITLALAAADGFFAGLKNIIMQGAAVRWITSVRQAAFSRIISQDKAWFDDPFNNPARLVQVLIKDADDARNLLATCLGVFVVVVAMLGVGLVWALIWGWQLTLVGVAICPVFIGAMYLQSRLTASFQVKNKRAREELSKVYFEAISNVRGIRAMAFQRAFSGQFDTALAKTLETGVKGAFVEGCAFGVTNAMIYLAEALLFYTGAVLVANGTFTYLRMIQVLNLLVFSVSIAAQMMVYIDKVTQSAQAARDMHEVLSLSADTQESRGDQCPIIRGRVSFRNVTFAYPQRPDVPVLKDVCLDFTEGECVAIVGSSGSGKSTIAALLQRLYEPSNGSIAVGNTSIAQTEVSWLREHISVVSQNSRLFDATIHENIAYGASEFPFAQVRRAAKASNVHEFIMSLPKDYNTNVGENASLISGGQAQRLQIARALVRPANILVLDECTSALDAANQAAVMETIQRVKVGRTTILITHKLPIMRMCDRIVVMHEGAVAEQGTYGQLMDQRGMFFDLANAGEWSDDKQ